jgi:ribosomal-protein-alanine N-acetyltransferase
VGSIGLNAIARGPFQNTLLGYSLEGKLQGQGLMQEALSAVIAHAFSAEINLHRIQANVRPDNLRSLKVLARLGFEREGFARDYLFIHDKWHDHIMFALRNENFKGIPI